MTDAPEPLDPAVLRQTNAIAEPLGDLPIVGDAEERAVLVTATPNGVVTVRLNRPHKKNALNRDLIAALREEFETLHGQDHVRAVFLRGVGAAFCSGADLDWMREAADYSDSDNRADAYELARMLKALNDVPALTVALVQGPAMGGGAGLVAACDVAVSTADARFAFSEVKLGLTPATISPYVVRALGPRTAKFLFATGQMFGAEDARRWGLINQVVENEDALEAVRDGVAGVMAACAPGAVGDAKRLVDDVYARELDDRLMHDTARRIAERRASAEGREGVAAFLGRRTPSWAEPVTE